MLDYVHYCLVFDFRAELFLFSCTARSCELYVSHMRLAYASKHLYIACFPSGLRFPRVSPFPSFVCLFFSSCHMYHFILEYKSHEVTVGTYV